MKIPINIKTGTIAAEKENKEIIVGIDLGTTNSLIAYISDGSPVTVKSGNGKNSLTPSVLYFDENNEITVGEEAKAHLIKDPERTIFSVKRLMGKSYKDVDKLRSSIGYEIIDEDKESLVKIKTGNKFYTPVELSAEILKSLKRDAENLLQTTINKAVITVPAYFNDAQRQATRDVGKLAGLDVLRIVNEPTAASLAYGIGLDRTHKSNIAVYDLGGGTFDVSILHLEDGIFEVLSTHGDTFLGGDDFDRNIVAYWAEQNNITQKELITNPLLNQQLRLAAEEAKKALSTSNRFTTTVNEMELQLDLDIFNGLIEKLIDKTIISCGQALKDAKLSMSDIDKVILVGGSTRVALIKEKLKSFFGQEPDNSMDPDEVVALGAAIQADILAGNRKDILLLDVTPLSLGIETVGGLMDIIIPRNSKVPHRAGRNYTTSVDGQKNLRISVYQGERDLVQDNRKLGEFILKNLPPMPAGLPKIEVQFTLDADGILNVKAKELRSDMETSVEIKSTYGISEEEMALMLLESIRNAETDMRVRALRESITEAQMLLLSVDKFILQNTDILTEFEKNEIKKFSDLLKSSIEMQDKDAVELAMKNLNDYSAPLAHKALDININKSLKGEIV
ncbi:MAG: Fe-S protein assembly chaperone HscA [Saprospiraceae bacterium]|nr:Fe-S protein assembly chaperone HscA [Saprospiraceae bacterium]